MVAPAQSIPGAPSPEHMAEVRARVFGEAIPLLVQWEACVACGLCSDSCQRYVIHNREIDSPPAKVRAIVRLLKSHPPDLATFDEATRMAFSRCSLCGRCSRQCPFGVDVSRLMMLVRRAAHLLDIEPTAIRESVERQAATGNVLGWSPSSWTTWIASQQHQLRQVLPNASIPVDRPDADMLVVVDSRTLASGSLLNTAILLEAARCNWTVSSKPGWDACALWDRFAVPEVAGRALLNMIDTALELRAKAIVVAEGGHCPNGHATDDHVKWLGFNHLPVPVVHAIELYDDLIRSGGIQIARRIVSPVTIQDPCRLPPALHRKLRNVVHAFCSHVHDIAPTANDVKCCGAGGGLLDATPAATADDEWSKRVRGSGAEIVIAPCTDCHRGVRSSLAQNNSDMRVMFLHELLIEAMHLRVGQNEE